MIDLYALPDHEDRAVCAEPAACVVCVLSPLDGESRTDWLMRLRGEATVQTSEDDTCCTNGHPWTPETTRIQSHARSTWKACVVCKRGSERRFREKQVEGHQRCSRCKSWRPLVNFEAPQVTCTPCLVARRSQKFAAVAS